MLAGASGCSAGHVVGSVTTQAAVLTGQNWHVSTAPGPGWRVIESFPPRTGLGTIVPTSRTSAWATECGVPCAYADPVPVLRLTDTTWRQVPLPPVTRHTHNDGPTLAAPPGSAQAWAVYGSYDHLVRPVVVRWTGRSWTRPVLLRAGLDVTAVVAPATSSAWIFGVIGGVASATPAYPARWNGRTWSQAPSPGYPAYCASARSASDIWVVGEDAHGLAVSHWTGSKWARTKVSPPVGGTQHDAACQLTVSGTSDVWDYAYSDYTSPSGPVETPLRPAEFVHWNGKTWTTVATPFPLGLFSGLAADGKGGIWFAATDGRAQERSTTPGPQYLFHVTSTGHWVVLPLSAVKGAALASVGTLALIPGTTSLYAIAATDPARKYAHGALLKYG
jgi:hypothetical protein